MFLDLSYAQEFLSDIQQAINASINSTNEHENHLKEVYKEPNNVLHELQNQQCGSNMKPTNGENIHQTVSLNSVPSVKKHATLGTQSADYPQAKIDMGFEVPEDEDFNAHLFEGFSKQDSSDEAAESGENIAEEIDEDEGHVSKKSRKWFNFCYYLLSHTRYYVHSQYFLQILGQSKSPNWSKQECGTFLSLYKEHKDLYAKKNRTFWQIIIAELSKQNIIRTKNQCEKKMESLKGKFRKAVDGDENLENFDASYKYFFGLFINKICKYFKREDFTAS